MVTGTGDVLHEGADQGLPAGLAQCLGGLIVREETISKILLMTQNSVQSRNTVYGQRLKIEFSAATTQEQINSQLPHAWSFYTVLL